MLVPYACYLLTGTADRVDKTGMNGYRLASMFCTAIWLCSTAGGGLARSEEKQASEEEAAEGKPVEGQTAKGPQWLTWGFDYQGRSELRGNLDFDNDHRNAYFLSRLRSSVGIRPQTWLRFYTEVQDSRAPGFTDDAAADGVSHHLDFRQAYVELGREGTTGWALRIGRQELAWGDERLLGADPFWDNLGQTFDAVRLSWSRPRLRMSGFASFHITPNRDQMMRGLSSNQMYGLYASGNIGADSVLEPYFFWNSNHLMPDPNGQPGGCDVFTYGIRSAGKLRPHFDYNVEMALQGGHRPAGDILAWAGHWELGYQFSAWRQPARLGAEYNFASGANYPFFGRHNTFDDLYPAGYNKFGMMDPFPWRNIKGFAISLELRPARRWSVVAGYRGFWLANVRDALYSGGDDYYRWNPAASSSYVGSQAMLLMSFEATKRSRFVVGYAYFFPGRYLLESSLEGRMDTPFVMWSYRL